MIFNKCENTHYKTDSFLFNPFNTCLYKTKITADVNEKLIAFIDKYRVLSKTRNINSKIINSNSDYDLKSNTIINGELVSVDKNLQKISFDNIVCNVIEFLVEDYGKNLVDLKINSLTHNFLNSMMIKNNINNTISTIKEEVKKHKVSIESIWYVVMKQGDFHIIHNHKAESQFSGAIYLKCPKFKYPQGAINFVVNDSVYTFTPEDCDVLIWPSEYEHFVYPFSDDSERLMISFNASWSQI